MGDARDELDWNDAKRADMVELAHGLGARLKRSGRFLVGPCLSGCAHENGFIINPQKQLFFCRPSGARGDAVDMVEHVLGYSKVEALAYVVGREPGAGAARPRRANEGIRTRAAAAAPAPATTTTADAMTLWGQGVDPRGTLAERYLNRERKLELAADLCGDVLRWHPDINALLAVFRNIMSGAPQAISRIFIDQDGRKIERRFTGPVGGAAIMLDPLEDVLEGLHIGEGAETVMAARQLGLRPGWSLGSKNGIAAFPVLNGVNSLTLLEENDGGKSAAACEACALRWHAAGREVIINRSAVGKDLNDALKGESAA